MNDAATMYDQLENCDGLDESGFIGIEHSLDLRDLELDPSMTTFIPSPAPETMEVGFESKPVHEFPTFPRGPPERTCYAGDFNFTVEVNSSDVQRKTFLYSHLLNRIYVDMKCNFSILFNWEYASAPHMFVRATPVFSDETQAEKRVERCMQHFFESPQDCRKEFAKSVLHSSREAGTAGVSYCGAADVPDSWFSVLVEFSRRSKEPCSHAFQFSCKNSCATGINRRAIAIIFTLEDEFGRVFGRQSVGARVCACPKRDLLKDESAERTQRSAKRERPDALEPHKTKKIKREDLTDFDDSVYKLPQLQVVGFRAMRCGLKIMQEMMEQAADCRRNDQEVAALYDKHIADFKQAIKKLENTKAPPPQ